MISKDVVYTVCTGVGSGVGVTHVIAYVYDSIYWTSVDFK